MITWLLENTRGNTKANIFCYNVIASAIEFCGAKLLFTKRHSLYLVTEHCNAPVQSSQHTFGFRMFCFTERVGSYTEAAGFEFRMGQPAILRISIVTLIVPSELREYNLNLGHNYFIIRAINLQFKCYLRYIIWLVTASKNIPQTVIWMF
jgi:hypothetical protein